MAREVQVSKGKNLTPDQQLTEFHKLIKKTLGEHGEQIFLNKGEKIPILGQLTNSKHIGITILENNMYRMPVFKRKARKTDFVLVRTKVKGKTKYFLRRIKNVYTTGQIQPKVEVFCPYSRQFSTFLKKLMKYYITKKFEEQKGIHLNELKEFLPSINDHNLRKTIKMLGGEQDTVDSKFYHFNP